MQVKSGGASDVGNVRGNNEDFYGIDPKGHIFVLADGMGGHAAGEVASRMACEGIVRALLPHREELVRLAIDGHPQARQTLLAALRGALVAAEQDLFDRIAEDASHKGMATTCELIFLAAGTAFIAHVGDSRIYLLRGDTGRQLTVDHTVANFLRMQGRNPEEISRNPHKDKLVRAIGMSGGAESDTLQLDLRTGDRLVLCSDGLYRYLSHPMQLRQLYGNREPQEAADFLCDWALRQGGEDNVTTICIEVVSPGTRPAHVETESRIDALKTLNLFQNLDYQEMLQVMPITYERYAAPSSEIIREGDEGDELYLLITGTCNVLSKGVTVAQLNAGTVFGELALFDKRPRSATIVADTPCRLLVIRRTDFENLTSSGPLAIKLLQNVIGDLATRLRNATDRIAKQSQPDRDRDSHDSTD